jgi:hypothetical protein
VAAAAAWTQQQEQPQITSTAIWQCLQDKVQHQKGMIHYCSIIQPDKPDYFQQPGCCVACPCSKPAHAQRTQIETTEPTAAMAQAMCAPAVSSCKHKLHHAKSA